MAAARAATRTWTAPDDLVARLRKRWQTGAYLTAFASGEAFEPVGVPVRGPAVGEMAARFGEVQAWVQRWQRADLALIRLEYAQIGGRVIGSNVIPCRAWVDSYDQLWALLGVSEEVRRFTELVGLTEERAPRLVPWLIAHPMRTLGLAQSWVEIVATVIWIDQRQHPGMYLRQVDVPGVDTKFIERHRGVLADLLDLQLGPAPADTVTAGTNQAGPGPAGAVRAGMGLAGPGPADAVRAGMGVAGPGPAGAVRGGMGLAGPGPADAVPSRAGRIDPAAPRSDFARRYGFRAKPQYVRFRLPGTGIKLGCGEFSELSLRAEEFSGAPAGINAVYVVENEITYLAFPVATATMVIFGGGYAVSALESLGWLADMDVTYWGDIDTHGFAILNQLRRRFPQVRSMLMDRVTLLAHRSQWVSEPSQLNAPLDLLDPDEAALYHDLISDALGQSVRLEQERVRFSAIERAVGWPGVTLTQLCGKSPRTASRST
ncbi:MAG TPA: Wadjet anti-phage system protein JetD domain-containing protein, partial [Streptosporangiaceae bacterium]